MFVLGQKYPSWSLLKFPVPNVIEEKCFFTYRSVGYKELLLRIFTIPPFLQHKLFMLQKRRDSAPSRARLTDHRLDYPWGNQADALGPTWYQSDCRIPRWSSWPLWCRFSRACHFTIWLAIHVCVQFVLRNPCWIGCCLGWLDRRKKIESIGNRVMSTERKRHSKTRSDF